MSKQALNSTPVFAKISKDLADVSSAVARTPNRFTTSEYIAASGFKKSAAKDRLNALLKAGKLRRIRMNVTKADGTVQPLAAWEYIDDAGGHESI